MLARVAVFEGGSADALRASVDRMNQETGPPPGVPAVGLTMLADYESGRSIGIVLFENEDDYATGDATLSEMSPTEDTGRRVSLEKLEVAADIRL